MERRESEISTATLAVNNTNQSHSQLCSQAQIKICIVLFCHYVYQHSQQSTYFHLIHTDTDTLTHMHQPSITRWISLPLPRTLHSRVLTAVFVPPSHIPFSSPLFKFCVLINEQQHFFLIPSQFCYLHSHQLILIFITYHWYIHTDTQTAMKSFLIFIIVLFFD